MKRMGSLLFVVLASSLLSASVVNGAVSTVFKISNNLTFTYDSPDYPWGAEELAALQQEVADFYPSIKKVYGPPSSRSVVNIEKNPFLSVDAQFDPLTNTIWLQGVPNPDRLCHEMIHAFQGNFIVNNNVYDEGMTRAAEVAVMDLLPQYQYWNSHHQYGIDVYYDAQNVQAVASLGGSFFLGFPNQLLKYQQSGYAWAKMFLEDRLFFQKFNRRYYAAAAADPGISGDVDALKEIARSVKPRVEGALFDDWYAAQWIFDMNPPAGYQRVFKPDTYTFYVYYREENGAEYPSSGITVSWNVYGCSGGQLAAGSGVTGDYGWVDITPSGISYEGQVRIEITAFLPGGELSQTVYTIFGAYGGLFGITPGTCDGKVQMSRAKDRSQAVSVVNGAFEFLDAGSAGQYRLTSGTNVRTVTKDEGSYFVSIQ